ncbi:hypothetical protein ScPMuIL_015719 [Solemya velum]
MSYTRVETTIFQWNKTAKRESMTLKAFRTLSVCIIVAMPLVSSVLKNAETGGSVNTTNLIHQIALVCGLEHICNKTVLDFSFIPNFMLNHSTVCPICSCDNTCYNRNDCCPDKLLLGPELDCINTTLVSKPGSVRSSKYQMVVDCPSPNIDLQEKCSAQDDSNRNVHNIPVTSPNGITYRNRYCAVCHNVSHDFVTWKMSIDCMDAWAISEFNYVASIKETVTLARHKICELEYVTSGPKVVCNRDDNKILISRCNTTGKWKDNDPDLKWACENYYFPVRFDIFRNIFCYLCNPIADDEERISICNNDWIESDLNRACVEFRSHYRTYPYKNVFCFECNHHPSLAFSDIKTYDVMLSGWTISIAFQDLSYPITTVQTRTFPQTPKHTWDDIQHNGKTVNVTNLLYDYALFEGTSLCHPNNYSIPLSNITDSRCRCDRDCILDHSCCMDVAMKMANYCTSNQILTDINHRRDEDMYIIVGDCPNRPRDDSLITLCEENENGDIKSKIPVYSPRSFITYKNIYCAICHESIQEDDTNRTHKILEFNPWKIQIKCKPFTDYSFFTSLESVLEHAKSNKCVVETVSDVAAASRKCSVTADRIGQCNKTSLWSNYDPDIEWACETLDSPYINNSNTFCQICNPTDFDSNFIDACNVTGNVSSVNTIDAYGCEHLPQHHSSLPYKNGFCRRCNIRKSSEDSPPPITIEANNTTRFDPSVTSASYRILFSLNGFMEMPKSKEPNTNNCSGNQIYDQFKNLCKEVRCSAGKIFENRTCVPLFERGSYLRYRLFFGLETNLTDDAIDIHSLLQSLERNISQHLRSVSGSLKFVTRYLASDVPCTPRADDMMGSSKEQSGINVTMTVLYHSSFLVTSQVNRLATEKALIKSRRTTYYATFENRDIRFFASPNIKAHKIPLKMEYFKSRNMCYLFSFGYFKSRILYTSTPLFEIVSDLMTCERISIESDVEISKTTNQAYIRFADKTFDVDQYKPTSNGGIEICVEDYTIATSSTHSKIQHAVDIALGTFTLVFTCSSLVCLLLSFLTYCIFKSLRTLPGKNNMCLILSLFLAQATFQFGVFQTENMVVCLVVGIASHYFWLATFCCMSVCCFHMFLAFNIRFLTFYNTRNDNAIIRRYCLFSLGIPAIIVSLNYGINYAVFRGTYSGYGPNICFLTNPYSVGFTLALPLIVSTISNTVFFSLTLKNLRTSSKIRNTNMDRRQSVVYVKLFVLTGLTWILQIIDSNVDISTFSFLVTLVNGCQGVFIFLSYTCNLRVFKLYRSLCCKAPPLSDMTNTYPRITHTERVIESSIS